MKNSVEQLTFNWIFINDQTKQWYGIELAVIDFSYYDNQ